MRIIFHPSFDNGYYINLRERENYTIGTKIVGLMGLLEHLSLHNGLSGRYPSDGERAAAYLTYVGKCVNGTMIETSFRNDSLGVAQCILGWRDKLVMTGWTAEKCGTAQTPKLQLLSQIEELWKARMKGNADRWRDLVMLTEEHSLIEDDDTIECTCEKEQLPLLVQKVLESCNASFVSYPAKIQISDSCNICVIHYNDLTDAYRQIAAHAEDYKGYVIINRDNVSLNHILFSWGKPLQNATIQESNPLTLQLFKLAMSVFSRPLNIHNILSYLQLPVGPIPRKLRSKLAYILISEGGFGKIDWDKLSEDEIKELKDAEINTKWEWAIHDYINEEENAGEKGFTKVQRASKTTLLNYITDKSLEKGRNIPVDKLKEYIGGINKWASGKANSEEEDEMLKSQLSIVVSYFRQLVETLNDINEISYEELEKHIRTIYQPTTIVQARAQVGSLSIVNCCTQLLDTPENLLWLDCFGADTQTDQFEFLSTAEKTWLNNQEEILVPKLQDILDLNRREMIQSLSRIAGNITLVTADYFHNQKMAEHPIVAELKMQRGDKLMVSEGDVNLPFTNEKEIIKIEPQLQYKLDSFNLSGRSESNTSIDILINYPFDYTVHYVAQLGEPSKKELGSIQKVTGLVAHCFIEGLVDSVADLPKNERIDRMETLFKDEFDGRLEKAISTTGLVLMLKENEVEYKNLHYLLKQSIETLITIMREKQLVPIGCEMKYEEPLAEIDRFNARIDMELEDASGYAVIFDFKWSYSTFYGSKIKEGKAIQLELYRQELIQQGKKVSAVGYYLLPKCLLVTSDFDTLKDNKGKVIIQHIDAPQDVKLFEQIQNSISQRKNEIREGTIEEGEGMDIITLPYSQRFIKKGENLLSVGKVKRARKTKDNPEPDIKAINKDSQKVFTNKPESRFTKTQEFEDNNIPINEIPTTYPLMKGRLK